MKLSQKVQEAVAAIHAAAPLLADGSAAAPQTALILGSGLGSIAEAVGGPDKATVPFTSIPHFKASGAPSHAGQLHIGTLAGQPVAVMQGRLHGYEGHTAADVAFPVHVLAALGAKRLIVTNAAGAVNEGYCVGDIMLICDHINFTGENPLTMDADTDIPAPSYDMTHAYTPALQKLALDVAAEQGLTLRQGVYLGLRGPTFETPAEIRAFRLWGADAVGMSTVHEVMAASVLGLEVLGLSLMTNMAAGVEDKELSTDDVLDVSAQRGAAFAALVLGVLGRL